MNSDSLLTKKYSAIPSTLWPYYEDLVIKRPHHPIVKAIQNQGKDKTWSGINRLFEITSQNTGLPSGRLLQDMGFDRSNLDDNHLQSIFGVMRTVNLLVQIGFTKLRPLPPNKSRRESDLRGEFNRTMFAIEVFRSNEVAYRFPNHNSPTQNLQSYVATRYKEKRSQLDASMNTHKCSKALLVVVMDSQPAKALVSGDEWHEVAENTFEMMGNPDNTHLLVFTGMANSNGQDERILYPPLG